MPNNLKIADTNLPDLSGMSQKEQISTLTNYLYMLLENLRYVLNNLGISNFNDEELNGMQKLFNGPVIQQVQDVEGNLSTISQEVDNIITQVEDVEGNLSTISQDVDNITSQVEDVEGNYSNLSQEVNSLTSTVSNLSGQFSQVKQDVDGLNVTTAGGTTYISGNHVKSGTIEGSVIRCTLNSSEGASNGELQFYYNGSMVGRIQMDTYGNLDGSGDESKYRVFFEAMNNFVLKLISQSNMSITSKQGDVYIGADSGSVRIMGQEVARIQTPSNHWYDFRDDGIYLDSVKITN